MKEGKKNGINRHARVFPVTARLGQNRKRSPRGRLWKIVRGSKSESPRRSRSHEYNAYRSRTACAAQDEESRESSSHLDGTARSRRCCIAYTMALRFDFPRPSATVQRERFCTIIRIPPPKEYSSSGGEASLSFLFPINFSRTEIYISPMYNLTLFPTLAPHRMFKYHILFAICK